MTDVIIVVDTYSRDYFGSRMLMLKLKKMGIKSKLVGKYSVVQAVNKFTPKIVVVPNISSDYIASIREKVYIFYMPVESIGGNIELINLLHQPIVQKESTYLTDMEIVLCWGDRYFQGLKDLVNKSKLIITNYSNDQLIIAYSIN